MNKLLLILMFVSLLIPITSAFDFDNVKQFQKNGTYGTIIIKNAFGLGATLAEYTLLENTDGCFMDCYAEGTVKIYKSYDIFRDIIFKDKKGMIKQLNDPKIEIKRSQGQKWESYNGEALLPGTYRFKISAKKEALDSIDWIPSAFGKDLDDWAWWNALCTTRQPLNPNQNTVLELTELDHSYTNPIITELNISDSNNEVNISMHFFNKTKLFYISSNYTTSETYGYIYECNDALSNHIEIFTFYDGFENGSWNGTIFNQSSGSVGNSLLTKFDGTRSASFTDADAILRMGPLTGEQYIISFWINSTGVNNGAGTISGTQGAQRASMRSPLTDCSNLYWGYISTGSTF